MKTLQQSAVAWTDMARLDTDQAIKIAQWKRSLPLEITAWAKALCAVNGSMRLNKAVPATHIQAWFCDHFAAWEFLNPVGYQAFRADITDCVAHFCALVRAAACQVTFEILQGDDKCRAFHVDYNDLRLLCTYWGPGTQWQQAEQILQAHTGDIVLLRGHRHPLGGGVLHRSPPISHTGQNRLLLRLDTLSSSKE
jgi:hypothetical protein